MLGYSIFNKSINGIKTLSDGITIIENGTVSAIDLKGQVQDKQNDLQIGDSLTIDKNLRVDETATLNQVYVDGQNLNSFITSVNSFFSLSGSSNPILGDVSFGGKVSFINDVSFVNNNITYYNGLSTFTYPSNQLVFASRNNYFSNTNQFGNQVFFDNKATFSDDVNMDFDSRLVLFAPAGSVILNTTQLSKIKYSENISYDLHASNQDKDASIADLYSIKATLASNNTFTGSTNIFQNNLQIHNLEGDNSINSQLSLINSAKTDLSFVSSAQPGSYNAQVGTGDSLIFWNDKLGPGGLNLNGSLVLGAHGPIPGIRIAPADLNIGLRKLKFYDGYEVTQANMKKIEYLSSITSDVQTQINNKASLTSSNTFTATANYFNGILRIGPYLTDVEAYLDLLTEIKADFNYVDTQIAAAEMSGDISTITALADDDLTLTTTTNTKKVKISYYLEVSGLGASYETFRNKGKSVFEQQVTFENKTILQNEQDQCLSGTFGSNVTFSNIKSIPKYCRIYGGIDVTLPVPPSSGINNGYEVNLFKYSSLAQSQILSGASSIYAKNNATGSSTINFVNGQSSMKLIVFNDAWYEI